MSKRNENGFGALGVLVLCVVLVLVGAAIWYVLQKQDNTTITQNKTTTAKTMGLVSLDSSKLPDGWKTDPSYSKGESGVSIQDTTTNCWVQAGSTTDTVESNAPDVDHFGTARDAMISKGYTVEELSSKQLTIVVDGKEQAVDAKTVKVSQDVTTMVQQYAYIATPELYTYIQLSCPDETSLASAQKALLAVSFKDK